MVAVAGVLPVLSQIFGNGRSAIIQPAWATVALAIAITLIALDRFFGFSSAWARYMTTGQAISSGLNQFRIEWQKYKSQLSSDGSSSKSVEYLLDLAKSFVLQMDGLVQEETAQWVNEFRETLTEIERSAHNPAKSS